MGRIMHMQMLLLVAKGRRHRGLAILSMCQRLLKFAKVLAHDCLDKILITEAFLQSLGTALATSCAMTLKINGGCSWIVMMKTLGDGQARGHQQCRPGAGINL
jgi:hypothetical protein